MIKVLLADDDILALNRLSGLIDWNANGYEIVGQALGGTDCLKLISSLCPDILILDIDMPDKNGVDVTKEISRQKLPVKILILSNYDTFSFVRDALHYGAYDYLLKHQLNARILLEKLSEMKELMAKEGLTSTRLSFFTTVAKQQYLHSLIMNGITNQEKHIHMLTQEDFGCGSYCLVVMQITNFILITHFSPNMNREKLLDSISTLATNIFSSLKNGLITHLEYGQFAILFHFDNQISTQEILNQSSGIMRLLLSNIQKVFGLTSLYQTSDVFTDMGKLPQIYEQTRRILEKQPFTHLPSPLKNQLDLVEEKELTNALTALDVPRTEMLLQDIFARYQSSSGGLSQQLIEQLLLIGVRFQQNQKLEPVKNSDTELHKMNIADMQPQEICLFLNNYFKKIMERASGCGSRKYSPHIQNALLYIHENYRADISLVMLAEHLHVSHTHLSRLFAREVGTSFVDYLTTYRIERARQLILNSNLDLKTIGEESGFHSYNYFLRVYKEKTGHTPTQDMSER